MPPGMPGAQLQMIPSGSSSNLYTMTSPTEINSIQGEEPSAISMNQPGSILPNVNPYGVPYVAGGAASAPRYTYAR